MTEWGWYWGNGTEPESYNGPLSTREEAIEAGVEDVNYDGSSCFTVCEGRHRELICDFFYIDRVMEWFEEANEDIGHPEDGISAFKDVKPPQDRELEDALSAVFQEWRDRHEIGRAFMFAETRNESVHQRHQLYERSDRDAPDVIKDDNGDVVLQLCKRCGRGEVELELDNGTCPVAP